jgi:cell division protein FtsI/penicillin-binding protein 2
VFGRLGLEHVGGKALIDYASRFGFNQDLGGDFAVDRSQTRLDPENDWSVAETASGYTSETTMSPVHGALLAASAINGGRLVQPSLIDAITDENGIVLYANDEPVSRRVISEDTARQLRTMMADTVVHGTARSFFKGFFNGNLSDIEVGGKTGTLSGTKPRGMYDWFVGYASRGDRKLAYAVLCINQDFWYVKSTYVARKAIEHYFADQG